MNDIERITAAIAALQAQRAAIGDEVAETALGPLRERLAALQAQQETAAAQSLRRVTILFLDIVGSTALSSALDPEEIHGVIDGALQRLTGVVAAHGGRVLQYAGDSLLAVFGAADASEDDPERAVHCGLALLSAAAAHAQALRADHAIEGFGVRVGIHTGRVLLGGGVDAEHSIRGSPVNVAARMEQTAPVGGLRISHDTYVQVRGVFDVVGEPVELKGMEGPTPSYRVLRAKPRAFRVATRGVEGVETRMIGRDAELARLQRAFEALVGSPGVTAMLVVGDAGLGKSRLIHEFGNWAEARPEPFLICQGRALPHTRGQPFGLLRDILAWRLQISDADPAAVARDKLVAAVAPLFESDGDAHAHLLGHLIGLDFSASPHVAAIATDARQVRARGLHAAVEWLRRMSLRSAAPVLMLLDDLHWADDASLDFVDRLLRDARDMALLVVGLTRASLFDRRPDWPAAPWSTMTLAPLPVTERRALADELLQRIDEPPALLRELITGGAEGNPFYMEELLKMLIDDGAILTRGERWHVVPQRLLASRVPPTLVGVLQARLDTLTKDDLVTLQQAAVLGLVFWDGALVALSDGAAATAAALASLQRRELIVRHDASAIEGTREYGFKHQLLHQVVYEGVLRPDRRRWHARAARWLAGQGGDRPGEHLGAAADHYDLAGDPVNASRYFERAAEWAAVRGANAQMLEYVRRGLERAAADDLRLRWSLVAQRERFLINAGDRAAHTTDLETLAAFAEALDDDGLRADLLWRQAYALEDTGEFAAAAAASRRCLALAARAGDTEVATKAYAGLGYELMRLGDLDAAQHAVDEGLALARACGNRPIEPHLLTTAGGIARAHGDHAAALSTFEAALAVTRELGNRGNESMMLNNLGDGAMRVGDHAAAQAHLTAALAVAQATGNRTSESLALQNLAAVAHQRGEHAAARDWAEQALAVHRSMASPYAHGVALNVLGHAELAMGRTDAAAAAYGEARELFAAAGVAALEMEAVAGQVRVALARADIALALAGARRLLAYREHGGSYEGAEEPLRIELSCWQALQAAGDPRAAAVLGAAHADLQDQAARISDPRLRECLLREVPHHRAIVDAVERVS